MLYAVAALCVHRHIDPFNHVESIGLVKQADDIVSTLVESEAADDDRFSFNRFFKDATKSRKIDAAIAASIQIKVRTKPAEASVELKGRKVAKTKRRGGVRNPGR